MTRFGNVFFLSKLFKKKDVLVTSKKLPKWTHRTLTIRLLLGRGGEPELDHQSRVGGGP
jgi:uncharacterized protein (DUF779 family)